MATSTASGWGAVRAYMEMIKIEHSIFALPFAFLGMLWAADGWPPAAVIFWIVVAMVSCRSAAMAFNRIVDREIDAQNPRTRSRAIPAGLLRLRQVNLFFFASVAIFLLSAAMLNPLALALAPVALFVTLGYSYTKRFTPLCHFVLGLSLGIAPAAAWIGVRAELAPGIVWATVAVALWTAGFDILYSLQDEEFDRSAGLRSMPETLGKPRALTVSRVCHAAAVLAWLAAGLTLGAGGWFFAGVAFAAAVLAYEQSLVRPDDLSKVNVAFFTLNGYVSIGVFLFAVIDWFWRLQ
jgi:4-hydroxybenzoate polyprenyltransferase